MRLNSSGVLVTTNDASISGLTVGKGGGALTSNTAIGSSALAATNTVGFNVAVGTQALTANTSGDSSVAVGYRSLYNNTTGYQNAALGTQALQANTTGFANTAVGSSALLSNTTASNNTAVGYQALDANTTGTLNTAIGVNALGSNTTANRNNAFGSQALAANTTGFYNAAFGDRALQSNTTASYNTAYGYSLPSNTTGASNTSVGHATLEANTTGSNNIAIGDGALQNNISANNNTAVGYQAGLNATNASNTFIGRLAGSLITTGAANTIIGRYNGNEGGLDIRTGDNNIVLSDGDGNPRQFINSSGNVYLGTYPPKYQSGSGKFTVSQISTNWDANVFGNIFVDSQTAFNSDPRPGIVFGIPYTASASATGVSIQAYKVTATSGDFGQGFRITTQANGSSPSYKMTIDGVGNIGAPSGTNIYNASDIRLKKNIKTLDNSLAKINALRGVEFNWIDNFCEAENNKILYGFVAQEVEGVDENLIDPFGPAEIKVDDLTVDNPIRVNEKFILPLLVNAIKELNAKLEAQALEIATLKGN
jgi:hypothetical protein